MLDEAFEDLDDTLTDEPTLAAVEDSDHANRMIRAVARRRRDLADVEQIAQAEIDKIREWLDSQRTRLSTAGLELMLEGYHQARLAEDPRVKTLRFPAGELTARTGTRWEFDDGAFLTWAAQHRPDLVRTKHEPDKVTAKKVLAVRDDGQAVDPDTGEIAQGVTAHVSTAYAVRVNTGSSDAF